MNGIRKVKARVWKSSQLLCLVLSLLFQNASFAWNSGTEEKPGPEQARDVLSAWLGPSDPAAPGRFERNEHGYLLQLAFNSVVDPVAPANAKLFRLVTGDVSLPVYVKGDPFFIVEETVSLLPAPFSSAKMQYTRQLNIAGIAGLPDHSYSLWDWASGNESCPLGAGGDTVIAPFLEDTIACHKLNFHLGATNSHHFLPQAADMYEYYHRLAMEGADYCSLVKDRFDGSSLATQNGPFLDSFFQDCATHVLALEAFGQHFLQDAWAVGHMWHRWGEPDLRKIPATNPTATPFIKAALVAAGSGLIHGCEALGSVFEPCAGDALSAGLERGYWSESGVQPGVGDGHVDELLNSGKYEHQRLMLSICARTSVAQVWEALGGAVRPGPRKDNPGNAPEDRGTLDPSCLNQRNGFYAIFQGFGVGEPEQSLFSALPLFAAYFLPKDFPAEAAIQFRKDYWNFGNQMQGWSKTLFADAIPPWELLTVDVIGIPTNEGHSNKDTTPPAPFADPRTLVNYLDNPEHIDIQQGKTLLGDSVRSDDVLMRLFNKAHVYEWCRYFDDQNRPLPEILRDEVTARREAADPTVGLACEVCTEFAARHVQLPVGSDSMCESLDSSFNGYVIDEQLSGSGLDMPLKNAAASWCGCTITRANIIVTETREENPRFDTRTVYTQGLQDPILSQFYTGSPYCTAGGEQGSPLYSSAVNSEGEGEALLYPGTLTSFNVVDIYSPGNSSNRATCSSFVAVRDPGKTSEQVWINVAERRATISPFTSDREYQVRYYSGTPGDREATKRCQGGWTNVPFGAFAILDEFDCDHSFSYGAVTPE